MALAILSGPMLGGAVAQSAVNGGGDGRGGSVFVPSSGGGHGFPIGLGIGLGLAVGAGILAGILDSSSRSATPGTDTEPSEPPQRPDNPISPPRGVGSPRSSFPVTVVSTSSREHSPRPRRRPRRAPTPSFGGAPGGPSQSSAANLSRPGFDVPAPTERRYVPDEVLITTKGPIDPGRLRRFEARLGLTPLATARIGLLDADVHLYGLRAGASVASTIRQARGRSFVSEAEPNFLFSLQENPRAASAEKRVMPPPADTKAASGKPVEPPPPVQYAVGALHLVEAHQLATGAGIRIAVIDTGLDESDPDLEGAVVDRFDAVGGTFTPEGHGTAMAGAIVAHHTLTGVAPKARIIAIRAFSGGASQGRGSGYNILRGLDFAAGHAARIVNLSFAGPRDMLLRQALEAAGSRGVVAIAAAGNAGPRSTPLYPAAEDGVVAITAVDADEHIFARANRGSYIAAAAPGVDVIAPGLGASVQLSTGTSIAAAQASGVVALLLERSPRIGTTEVRRILRATARHLAADPADAGAGLIDARAAVGMAK